MLDRTARRPFLTADQAARVRERFGTPCYVYDAATLEATARQLLGFAAPYGFTLRYAMKANPSRRILHLFRELNAAGTTVVVITHDADVARRADRTITIRDGRIAADVAAGAWSPSTPTRLATLQERP